MAGLAIMISYFKLVSFICVTGMILFANKKASPANKIANKNKGRINRVNGIPAAFMATNSKLSPKLPKVIMDENSNANGSAVVKVLTDTRPINSRMVIKSSPFPTKSSMYNQKNCIVNTNIQMANAAKNGAMNARRISMSNFLNNVKVLISFLQRDEKAL
jgi:hypothetical protein